MSEKDSNRAFQVRMNFNPHPAKQAQEVISSRKTLKQNCPPHFSTKLCHSNNFPKNLGMVLDSKLDFKEQLQNTLNKVSKITSFLQKLHNVLPKSSLLTIFKSLIRPLLDYGDIFYDQT